jgi:hypothetical protein
MKVNRGSPVTDDMTPLGHHYGEWPRGMSRLSEAQIADSARLEIAPILPIGLRA